MSAVITCSFCKEKGHARVDEKGEIACPTLLSNLCTYCKKTGHTNRRCPVAKANHLAKMTKLHCTYCKKDGHHNRDCPVGKQALLDKTERQKDNKIKQIANRTYAGLVMSSISSDEEKKIEREEQEMLKMLRERREALQKSKKETWEANYPGKMEAYHGPFWMFYVYGTTYDYKSISEPLRDAKTQAEFLRHLEEKYPGDWMTEIINTKDFCPFVEKLIQNILEENVRITMESKAQILKEMEDLGKTLTPEELEAHLDAITDEFMAELGSVNTNWKKAGKKKTKKGSISDI